MPQFNGRTTQARIQRLKQYYEKEILGSQGFICQCYSECRESVRSIPKYYTGQLSHIGSKYDLQKDGRELRLIITGISYGHNGDFMNMTMEERGRLVVDDVGVECQFYKAANFGCRNPHMRGTTLLLKRILLGEQSLRNYNYASWEDEFIGKVGEKQDHIYNMFGLVNLLLCSAVADNAEDRSSRLMKQNCFRHYIQTLKILEPNLVILQTKGQFEPLLKGAGLEKYWRRQNENLGYFKGAGLKFVVCEFYHPAYRRQFWGCKPTAYFQNTVLPTLDVALPNIGLK